MKSQGLRSVVIKKYHHQSEKGIIPDNKENILKQDFTATTINQKWCTDITYIHVLREGWTYLASVMDLYNRKIIGYAYGKTMTTELALKAVENACMNVSDAKGIILHSDLGSQYTSQLFEKYMLQKETQVLLARLYDTCMYRIISLCIKKRRSIPKHLSKL